MKMLIFVRMIEFMDQSTKIERYIEILLRTVFCVRKETGSGALEERQNVERQVSSRGDGNSAYGGGSRDVPRCTAFLYLGGISNR